MLLTNIEFFTYDTEIWYRVADGSLSLLSENNYDMVRELYEFIGLFYPKAFKALKEEYKLCERNVGYHRFRVVARFIRCNFAKLDEIPDITNGCHCNFETVNCPLRGEYRLDRVVCHPEFDHRMSPAELRVIRLWYDGYSESEIGEQLCISEYTVHNHIRNAYSRIPVRNKSEFIKYATLNKLFE